MLFSYERTPKYRQTANHLFATCLIIIKSEYKKGTTKLRLTPQSTSDQLFLQPFLQSVDYLFKLTCFILNDKISRKISQFDRDKGIYIFKELCAFDLV